MSDCRNDCAPPLSFPREIFNRPGLARIAYNIGAYADIREALLRNLDRDPTLAGWTHRGADDPGIALLEGASILGDILTFYQELYANEAYLRTARWRRSIADLVRLLGYRLSPGLGGGATFAFEVKGDRAVTVPADFPVKAQVEGLEKPAEFETAAELVAYPWLSRFNLFRPLTQTDITVSPRTTEFYILTPDQVTTPVEIKPDDRLLVGNMVGGRLQNDEVVIVASTRVLHDRTIIKIKGTLKRTTNTPNLIAYKLGRTFRHFGHNGPLKKIIPPASATATSSTNYTVSPPVTTTTTNIPAPTERILNMLRPLNAAASTWFTSFGVDIGLTLSQLALDVEVDDLPTGVPLVVQFDAKVAFNFALPVPFTVVRNITNVKPAAYTWELLTGNTSIVTLDATLETVPPPSFYYADIRTFRIHETLSPQLRLAALPIEAATPTGGPHLFFFGTQAHANNLAGRPIQFVKPDGTVSESVVIEVAQDPSPVFALRTRLRRLTVSPGVTYADFPNDNPSVVVYGNLVEATQGKTEREAPVGNGDARQVFQTFKLPKAPLTYLLSPGDTPPEVPELEVYVNGRLWERVPSLFGRSADEQIYIVREDANDDSWVQFGDGKTGARLPSGVNNVVVRFRTGTGAFGPLKPETTVQAGARLDRLDKIQMPGTSAGGSAPEDGENAREAAPGKIQSLDRLVSISDFEAETLAISGVERALAAWQLDADNIPGVHVTVLMQSGRAQEIEAVRQVLADFNRCRGPRRFPVVVDEGLLMYVGVALVYGLAPTYREDVVTPAIIAALGVAGSVGDNRRGLFGTLRRRFGEAEYATRIEGTVQNVEGVLWAKVNAFDLLNASAQPPGEPVDPTELTLPSTRTLQPSIGCNSPFMLALHTLHLTVAAVAELSQEAC